MPALYTILYPKGAVFYIDHYINKHMPMARQLLPDIILDYKVYRLPEDSPYSIQCDATFASEEAQRTLADSENGRRLLGGLANFSTESPLILAKAEVGSSA